MKRWPLWLIVMVCLLVGITIGGVGVGTIMVGPAGFRQQSATHPTPSTPSAAAAVFSSPSAVPGHATPSPLAPPNQAIPSPSAPPNQATNPRPRTGAAMAFDAATGKLVLFGGLEGIYGTNGANPLSDTWSWDGNRWSSVPTSSNPVARIGAAMAYDGVRRVIVLRGGVDTRGNFINETWTWDGVRWTQMSPLQSPPVDPWIGTQPMCWDSARGAVLLFNDAGGVNGVPEDDQLWAWSGTTWTLVPAGGATPSGHGGEQSAVAFDTSRNSVVFFSRVNSTPTTWSFNGTTWTQASTSGTAAGGFSMVADDARSNVVLFGGNGDTWIWDGARWTAQNPVHSPSPRTGAAMAYDQVRRVVLLFGGSTGVGAGTTNLNDLWAWNGVDWTQLSPSS